MRRIVWQILICTMISSNIIVAMNKNYIVKSLKQADEYRNQGDVKRAENMYKKAYDESKKDKTSILFADSAYKLGALYQNRGSATKEPHEQRSLFSRAVKYLTEAYKAINLLLSQSPNNEQIQNIYSAVATSLEINSLIEYDVKNGMRYAEEAYTVAFDIPPLRISNAINLAMIYQTYFFDDTNHNKALKILQDALALIMDKANGKAIIIQKRIDQLQQPKEFIEIEHKDGLRERVVLQTKYPIIEGTNDTLDKIIQDRIPIVRVIARNDDGTFDSFYGGIRELISWLWSPKIVDLFISESEDAQNNFEKERRKIILDGRPIVAVEFFKWIGDRVVYVFNDQELFETNASRYNRLLIAEGSSKYPALRAASKVLLSEIYYLGIGVEKDLIKAQLMLKEIDPSNITRPDIISRKSELEDAITIGLAEQYLHEGNMQQAMIYLQRASLQSKDSSIRLLALARLASHYKESGEATKELFCINKLLQIKDVPLLSRLYYEETKKELGRTINMPTGTLQSTSASNKNKKRIKKKNQPQEVSESIAQSIESQSTEESKKPEEAIESVADIESEHATAEVAQEEPIVDAERDAIDAVIAQVNAERVESYLKYFDISIQAYANNRRNITALRDAKQVLEKVEALAIDDNRLQQRLTNARVKLRESLQGVAQEGQLQVAGASRKIIFDPFNERASIPTVFEKTLHTSLQQLIDNQYGQGAVSIQGGIDGNPVWRIHVARDYRLFYMITPHTISIVAIDKKGNSTYNKLDERYRSRVAWILKAESLNGDQLMQFIEQEQKDGHAQKEQALRELQMAITGQ